MLGVKLPGGQEITCVVHIDHNLGSLVKDAFVVPAPIATVEAVSRRAAGDPDTSWDDMRLADARAWVDDAIHKAAITYPPLETGSFARMSRTSRVGHTGLARWWNQIPAAKILFGESPPADRAVLRFASWSRS